MEDSILIKNALTLTSKGASRQNIEIIGNTIQSISGCGSGRNFHRADKSGTVIDASSMAAIPGLINSHTHAAMTLLRGYGDDMELNEWLKQKIWPAEARLKPKHIRAGTNLACLEMALSGTTAFNDMYFFPEETAAAVKNFGLRAVVSLPVISALRRRTKISSNSSSSHFKSLSSDLHSLISTIKSLNCSRISVALAPHSVYACSKKDLAECAELSEKHNIMLHTHVSETRWENEQSFNQHGKRPLSVLENCNALTPRTVLSHCTWLTKEEVRIVAKHGCKVAYNPTANMKLATGGVMPYAELAKAGVTIGIGTDGVASNNNLDMFSAMKFATLVQKSHRWDQTVLPAKEALQCATANGAKLLGINSGQIRQGALADIALIDLKKPELNPLHSLESNLVYAANGSCVDTLICDGKIIFENRNIPDSDKILEHAENAAFDLAGQK